MNDALNEAVRRHWRSLREEMIEVSRELWSLAEIGMVEHRSAALLAGWCERHGFEVERGAGGIPTAFAARSGSDGPTVGLLAEYDALPSVGNAASTERDRAGFAAGHGCGHNWIGAGPTGAAIAARHALDELELPGRISVLGCPAEEMLWGKVAMLREGVFDGIDAFLAGHASYRTGPRCRPSQALVSGEFVYLGESGHASMGGASNALDAVEFAVQSIDRLRAHQFPDCSVEHVVRQGGFMPNISPDEARLWIYARHVDHARAREVYDYVVRICEAAAEINNTVCRQQFLTATRGYLPNETLARRLLGHMESVGPPRWSDADLASMRELVAACAPGAEFELHDEVEFQDTGADSSSQDDGEASWHIPLGRVSWAVPNAIPFHHWALTAHMGNDAAIPAALVASETLALGAADLATAPDVVAAARDELLDRRGAEPGPPLVGAFETLTAAPESFWDSTWTEAMTVEEAEVAGRSR